jgi:hypothetical protein
MGVAAGRLRAVVDVLDLAQDAVAAIAIVTLIAAQRSPWARPDTPRRAAGLSTVVRPIAAPSSVATATNGHRATRR